MHLIYKAGRRNDACWPGAFERERLAQHAIVRRATKDGLGARYFDNGREVILVCQGPARLVAGLVDNLQQEHVLGFELYTTTAEFDALLDLVAMHRLPKDRVAFKVDRASAYDTSDPRAAEPHDYDRRTLPELIRVLVAPPEPSAAPLRETFEEGRFATGSYYRGLLNGDNETRIDFVAPRPIGGASVRVVGNPLGTESYGWDNTGAGANRTAEALLYDVVGDGQVVARFSQLFSCKVVSLLTHGFQRQPLPDGIWTEEWRLPHEEVRAWIFDHRSRREPKGPLPPLPFF